jgi:hypothetical protein
MKHKEKMVYVVGGILRRNDQTSLGIGSFDSPQRDTLIIDPYLEDNMTKRMSMSLEGGQTLVS